LLGAIAGDIIGSPYEWRPIKTSQFPLFSAGSRFTDDTVLTAAVAECLLTDSDYTEAYIKYFSTYPDAGYGGRFFDWARTEAREPYGSFGNGSAMRVSPVGWAFDTLEDVLVEAGRSAAATHDHQEGIKGAQAIAAAIFLARSSQSKDEISAYIEDKFEYNVSIPLDEIRPSYKFEVTCQGSVPPAFRAFLEADDYEDAVRKAISLGGDSDTLACMAGAIAHAFYGALPPAIADEALGRLDDRLRLVTSEFMAAFKVP